ncbi:MAG: MarR family transcriptional regulator [Propionibacteriaceae bacterium]|jgi:DNA-binding MarR family transcriptional regulator|nr:MarR family transcriptional regulator [Propionibacteriaceae bacterium]
MTKPPTLNNDQVTIWRSWLLGYEHVASAMERTLSPYGIDTSQLRVLMLLSESKGHRMRMFDIARAANRSPSRLSHMVARMETEGLVVRQPCENDRRGAWLFLTDAGVNVLHQVETPHMLDIHRTFIDAIGARDFLAIGRAMRKVLEVNADPKCKRTMAQYEWWPALD